MTYELADRIAILRRGDLAFNMLEADLVAEKASSLGHQGRKVEQAMAALRAFDAATGDPRERLRLLKLAAEDVWAFFIQREFCGLRDSNQIIKDYGIPDEVLVRLGAVEK